MCLTVRLGADKISVGMANARPRAANTRCEVEFWCRSMSMCFAKNNIPHILAPQDYTGCLDRVGARLDHLLVDMINSRNQYRRCPVLPRFKIDGRDT